MSSNGFLWIIGALSLLLVLCVATILLLLRRRPSADDGDEETAEAEELPDSEFVAVGHEDAVFVSRLDGGTLARDSESLSLRSDAPVETVSVEGLVSDDEKSTEAENDSARAAQEIARLQASLQEAQQAQKLLERQKRALDKELDERNRLIAIRDESIRHLSAEMAKQSAEIDRLKQARTQTAAKSKSAAEEMEQQLAEYEETVEALQARVSEVTDRSGKLKRGIANALTVLGNTAGATSVDYLLETIREVATDLNRVLHPEEQ